MWMLSNIPPTLLLVLLYYPTIHGEDLTIVPEQKGDIVVNAVVDVIRENCIFESDRLLLKRLASIQSSYGLDSTTYRKGYHGGIWQVSKKIYEETKSCPYKIAKICSQIQDKLQINWRQTSWTDLRKPLYSGIAASLYIIQNYDTSVPGDPSSQAEIWTKLFAPQGNQTKFISLAENSNVQCEKPIDLAFIIDSSGSIGSTNFKTTLEFMKDITDALDIGKTKTQVAVVEFSTSARLQFNLTQYNNRADVQQAINGIAYSGGGTNTAIGLRMAAEDVFVPSGGIRSNSAQVALVITDGQSNSFSETSNAADELRAQGVVVFAIGIGGARVNELNAIATNPDCTHVFFIAGYSEIDSIINEIQKSACRAQITLPDTGNGMNKTFPIGNKTEINISIPSTPGNSSNTTTTTLVTNINCGTVYIYGSYDSTHPSEALFSFSDVAVSGLASVLKMSDGSGRTLYITYQGKKYQGDATKVNIDCETPSITSAVYSGDPPGAEIVCRKNGVEKLCTLDDFENSPYKDFFLKDEALNAANPCTPGADVSIPDNRFHPNKLDTTKFITCNSDGKIFIMQCPNGDTYNSQTFRCGASNQLNTGLPLPDVHVARNQTSTETQKDNLFTGLNQALTSVKQIVRETNTAGVEVICRQDSVDVECTYFIVQISNYSELLTKDAWQGVNNPCGVTQKQRYRNDLDTKKFVNCDGGVMYVGQCPDDLEYYPESSTCGMVNPVIVPTPTTTPVPPNPKDIVDDIVNVVNTLNDFLVGLFG